MATKKLQILGNVITTDEALTQSGVAADAKAVGDKIANLSGLIGDTSVSEQISTAIASEVHEHSNLSVLEGITSDKVTAWDAAEGSAKTYADGLNTAMDTRVATLETWHNNFTEVSEEEINALFT